MKTLFIYFSLVFSLFSVQAFAGNSIFEQTDNRIYLAGSDCDDVYESCQSSCESIKEQCSDSNQEKKCLSKVSKCQSKCDRYKKSCSR